MHPRHRPRRRIPRVRPCVTATRNKAANPAASASSSAESPPVLAAPPLLHSLEVQKSRSHASRGPIGLTLDCEP